MEGSQSYDIPVMQSDKIFANIKLSENKTGFKSFV